MKPMLFHEAPVEEIGQYITHPDWFFQQKVDGIRGLLMIEPGKTPWFQSRGGQPLVSSTAAKITRPLLKRFGEQPDDGIAYVIDGELLNGAWYVFDLVVDGAKDIPYAVRATLVENWVRAVGLDTVRVLPLARTEAEKTALVEKIQAGGGEGVLMKHRDGDYGAGKRVTHSLKAKFVSTADVVVLELNRNGRENAILGAYDSTGELIEIGAASMIGKIKRLGPIDVGSVVEVKYLYSDRNNSLVQPRIIKLRTDKQQHEATTAQLRKVSKDVLTF